MLRRVAVSVVITPPLPRLARVAAEWVAAVPLDEPALFPPFVLDIR
jgi:hypothetical protein